MGVDEKTVQSPGEVFDRFWWGVDKGSGTFFKVYLSVSIYMLKFESQT